MRDMVNVNYPRIMAVLVLGLLALYAPFWLTLIFGVACIAYFNYFVEAVFIGLLIDLLYGVSEARFYGFKLVAFVLFLAVFIISEILKKKMLAGRSFKGSRR